MRIQRRAAAKTCVGCMVLAFVAVLCAGCSTEEDNLADSVPDITANVGMVGKTDAPPLPDGKNKENYTIEFYSGGKLITRESVESGAPAPPPALFAPPASSVFIGWDGDITDITENTKLSALYRDISGLMNVFVLDTVYSGEREGIQVYLTLCGDVDLCLTDLCISFDPAVIRIDELIFTDPAVMAHVNNDAGRVKISLLSMKNITGAVDCLQLTVSFVLSGASSCELSLTVEEAARFGAGGEIEGVRTNTVNGKIVLY